MKTIVLAIVLLFTGTLAAKDKPKITKAQAKKIAQAQAPNLKIVEAELEKEKGKLVWSFDFKEGKDRREIQVDAMTGEVVVNHVETKAEEAAEKKAEKKEHHKKKK